ncbi:hypothetical protein JG687_00003871 [Phytophthora cactorum]|uniref:Uncharacterized protein n=1 Tax=Phytophthora cactorum TaxID=29920 RepID=A0A8T1URG8_9STRA|nr:hypothetical protein JG687_00003871 [Phytophthora cactorum]
MMPAPTRVWWFACTLPLAYTKELHIPLQGRGCGGLVYNIPERIDVILTQRIAEFSKFPTSVQTAPKNGLTVTDPMLTGDYAGARKVALAYAWLDANACSCFLGTNYPGQVAYQMFIPQPIKKVLQLMGTCMVTVFVTLVDSQPSRPRQPG